jgi:hypothetical protein
MFDYLLYIIIIMLIYGIKIIQKMPIFLTNRSMGSCIMDCWGGGDGHNFKNRATTERIHEL